MVAFLHPFVLCRRSSFEQTDPGWATSAQHHLLMLLMPSDASPEMAPVLNVSEQQYLAIKIHHIIEFLWAECDFIQKELC